MVRRAVRLTRDAHVVGDRRGRGRVGRYGAMVRRTNLARAWGRDGRRPGPGKHPAGRTRSPIIARPRSCAVPGGSSSHLWWTSVPPSNTGDWAPDVARTARASFDSSRVTIQNVRNFNYRSESDYDQRWETRTYEMDRVRGIDLFLSFWGPTQIAHTIVSWDFDDGQHLAISESRRAGRRASPILLFAASSISTSSTT